MRGDASCLHPVVNGAAMGTLHVFYFRPLYMSVLDLGARSRAPPWRSPRRPSSSQPKE